MIVVRFRGQFFGRSGGVRPHLPEERPEVVLLNPVVRMALLLAFPALAVAQTNFVTPVCDRTPRVQGEVMRLVSAVSDCADVTEAHLAEIEELRDLRRLQNMLSIHISDRDTREDIISELNAGDKPNIHNAAHGTDSPIACLE